MFEPLKFYCIHMKVCQRCVFESGYTSAQADESSYFAISSLYKMPMFINFFFYEKYKELENKTEIFHCLCLQLKDQMRRWFSFLCSEICYANVIYCIYFYQ